MKSNIIHIDGVDKTGKDTVRRKLVKKSKGNYLVIVRSFISQIAYSRIYNRKIDEEYFFNKALNAYKNGEIFILLHCGVNYAKERFLKHNEKDLKISDYDKHYSIFLEVASEMIDRGIQVLPIDTGALSISETISKIESGVFLENIKDCTKCSNSCIKPGIKFNVGSKYLFVSPTPLDFEKNSTVFLLNSLKDIGIEQSTFASLVQCKLDTVTNGNLEKCVDNLKHIVEVVQPTMIVALGKTVYDNLVRKKIFKVHNIIQIFAPSYCTTYKKISEEKYIKQLKTKLW